MVRYLDYVNIGTALSRLLILFLTLSLSLSLSLFGP